MVIPLGRSTETDAWWKFRFSDRCVCRPGVSRQLGGGLSARCPGRQYRHAAHRSGEKYPRNRDFCRARRWIRPAPVHPDSRRRFVRGICRKQVALARGVVQARESQGGETKTEQQQRRWLGNFRCATGLRRPRQPVAERRFTICSIGDIQRIQAEYAVTAKLVVEPDPRCIIGAVSVCLVGIAPDIVVPSVAGATVIGSAKNAQERGCLAAETRPKLTSRSDAPTPNSW